MVSLRWFSMTQGTLKLRGIDRIDVFEDENMTAQFQVIDYKTSSEYPMLNASSRSRFSVADLSPGVARNTSEQQPTDTVYIGLNAAEKKYRRRRADLI